MLSRRVLRIKVVKTLYAHFKSESESAAVSEKNLLAGIDKAYDLYLQLLWLPVEVKRYAEKRIELSRKKRLATPEDLNPNTRFVDNTLIAQLEESEVLTSLLEKKKLGWAKYPELVKSLYDSLTASEYYGKYMSAPAAGYKADVKLVEDFFLGEVNDSEQVETTIEEQSILWIDDLDFALIMVLKTLDASHAGQKDVPVLPQYKNDDDRRFAVELFRKAVVNYGEYLSCVDKFTRNWDVDRIAFMDNVIMVAAIAEITSFPSIPVKVSLDEYIEIAKYYSTQGSSVFINGILDKVIEVLSAEGKINKSGRGLL